MSSLQGSVKSIYDEFKYRINEVKQFADGIFFSFIMIGVLYKSPPPSGVASDIHNFAKIVMPNWDKVHDERIDEKIACRQIIITVCSIFEDYIISLLKTLYLNNPDKLKAQDKKARELQTITIEEILRYKDINTLIEDLVNKKVRDIIYNPIDRIVNKLKIFFKDFNLDEELENNIADLFLIRNVIVHNRGTINKEFLEKYRGKQNDMEEGVEVTLSYPMITDWASKEENRFNKISLVEQIGDKIFNAIQKFSVSEI